MSLIGNRKGMKVTDEERLLEKYGEQGLLNLKAHAELLNMSLDQLESISEVAPVAILEMLHEAMLRKQRDYPVRRIDGGRYA